MNWKAAVSMVVLAGTLQGSACLPLERDCTSRELSSPNVKKPVSVRYAWKSWIEPPVTLQNSAGLSVEPFAAEL